MSSSRVLILEGKKPFHYIPHDSMLSVYWQIYRYEIGKTTEEHTQTQFFFYWI